MSEQATNEVDWEAVEQGPYPRPDLFDKPFPRRFQYTKPVIDAHTHYYAPEFVDLVVAEADQNYGKVTGPDADGCYTLHAIGRGHGAGYYPYEGSKFSPFLSHIERQIAGMEDRGTDLHAIQMTHPKVYWAPPDFALRLCQAQNDGLSRLHQEHPDRFLGSIILPMQDVRLALKELERASQLPGLRGINVAHHINGLNASDRSFWDVWKACEELDQPLIMHNNDPLAPDRLYQGGIDLMNGLGNPFEATLSAVSMIVSGMLDAHPNLDVYLPHAGGALPWLIWRIDYQQAVGGWFTDIDTASTYLRRFYYDLILHSPKMSRIMFDIVGVDRIVSGTDWPQRMATWRPSEYVEQIPGITFEEAEAIMCDNPAKLLRLA